MKRGPPYLTLYPGDLLALTALWCGEARALHLLMLTLSWGTDGPLPAKPAQLARALNVRPALLKAAWPDLQHEWTERDGGLHCAWLEAERARITDISQVRAEAGRQGGLATQRGKASASANASSLPEQDASNEGARLKPSKPIQSNPSPAPASGTQTPSVSSPGDQDADWDEIRAAYPTSSRPHDWLAAERAYRTLIADEIATHAEVLAGVQRYAAYCDQANISATRYVKDPATFIGAANRWWQETWAPPPPSNPAAAGVERLRENIRRRLAPAAPQSAPPVENAPAPDPDSPASPAP